MNSRIATIGGIDYEAEITQDGKYAFIYTQNESDADFLGILEINENNQLVEYFPMTDRKVVIGKLIEKE